MRKFTTQFLLLASLILSTGVASAAMVDAPMRLRGGFRVGFDVSSLSTTRVLVNESGLAGFVTGGFLEIPIIPRLSIMPELDLVMKGAQFSSIGSSSSLNDRLLYLEAPIMVKVHWDWEKVRVFAQGGPAISLLLSAKQTDNVNGGPSTDVKSQFNTVDITLTGGGGVGFPLGENVELFFDTRLGIGLLSADTSLYNSHNVVVQFAAGLEF